MLKRKITIFYDGRPHTYRWLKSLSWAKNVFKKYSVNIEFADHKDFKFLLNRKPKRIYEYYEEKFTKAQKDIVFLAFRHGKSHFASLEKQQLIKLLKKLRSTSNMLVWLDTKDSTSGLAFFVLPYVDFYLKKQLLKNIELYKRPIYGKRIYSEYYHNRYGVLDDRTDRNYDLLNEKHKDKIKLSWNIGLGNIFTRKDIGGKLSRKKYIQYLLQSLYVKPKFTSVKSKRKYDIQYKGTQIRRLTYYQRFKTIELLKKRVDLNFPDISKKIPYKKYLEEIKQSKCVLSPFGAGEICTRDFEAFALGATLIKPDMEHLETYPNWYVKDETYISVDWDFSNFGEILDEINRDHEKYQAIAENAQKLVKKYRTDKFGKQDFVEHILKNIELM